MRVGVVVNPIAGTGGRVGLKGTDERLKEALELGAEPRARDRAVEALIRLRREAPEVTLITASGSMGENEALEAGFEPQVVHVGGDTYETTAEDTHAAVFRFIDESADLILFVGGDGTAADIAEALEEGDTEVPVLGVPAGVKVYSSVFAETPEDAGRIAASFDRTEKREVADIDEKAYRDDELRASVSAAVSVPVDGAVQETKSRPGGDTEGIARGFADEVREDTTYVFGTGGTLAAIKRTLGIEPTVLGVDVWHDGEVLARDASEKEILDTLGDRNVVVVSPIGGQGFVLGRGNQQISPAVVRRSRLQIVATREKLRELDELRVDIGDNSLEDRLRGWRRVRVGRNDWRMERVV